MKTFTEENDVLSSNFDFIDFYINEHAAFVWICVLKVSNIFT